MFSQRITNSARFQQMQLSAQALYFHLGMAADDDGVVEAFTVMRITKAADDDFRVLVAKEFIKPLNEEMVSYLLDWNEHNLIRQDRIVPSMYRELLVKILPEVELTEPKQRADRPLRLGRPGDNQGTAQDRIGKDKEPDIAPLVVVSDSEEENPRPSKEKDAFTPHYEEMCAWASKRRGFPFVSKKKQYAALKKARVLGIPPGKMKKRWEELEAEDWRDGFDWTSVVSSFDKRA